MLHEPEGVCPYCGETITLLVDCSAGDQRYIEDCFVCCQPIVVTVTTGTDGELTALALTAENP